MIAVVVGLRLPALDHDWCSHSVIEATSVAIDVDFDQSVYLRRILAGL
jgi:hypothetical protein